MTVCMGPDEVSWSFAAGCTKEVTMIQPKNLLKMIPTDNRGLDLVCFCDYHKA